MKPTACCRRTCLQPLAFAQGIFRNQLGTVLCPWFLLFFSIMNSSRLRTDGLIADPLANTSNLLDSLLSEQNYDRQIRPGFGGPPTEVLTDIEIRSFGSISETDMIFSMDCYFRQTWFDRRLKFHSGNLKVLSMDWKFLQKVWTPDTYFLNGKSSYLHKVTVPNKFIRVRNDGQLKYSMRLTVKANCPMHLRKYPLDSQACPLVIGSFAYTSRDVIYKWNGDEPVAVSKDVALSQYYFLNITLANNTVPSPRGGTWNVRTLHRDYSLDVLTQEFQRYNLDILGLQETRWTDLTSSLLARFILRRRRGYFILQIYAPCAMIVGASWVSFWINKSDAPGRVAVGATTVLTLVTMGFGGRSSLPRVAYATAIDWFVIMCFTFVFAAMVEYACVNFVDRRDLIWLQKRLEERQQENNCQDKETPQGNGEEARLGMEDEKKSISTSHHFSRKFRHFRRRNRKRYKEMSEREHCIGTDGDRGSRIDSYSRILFPFAFASFNMLYWTLYLYTIDDEISVDTH